MKADDDLASLPDRLFAAGLVAHKEGRLEDAFAQYEASLQHDPQHFDALHHVAILGYQSGNYALALEFIGAAIKVNPGVSAAYGNLGNIFKAIGEPASALQSYEQALACDGCNVDVLYNRGNVLQQLKRYDEAYDSYRQALRLAPKDVASWNNCAVVLRHLRRYQEALHSCDRAIALAPGHGEARYNRGKILLLLGRSSEALDSLRRAIAIEPAYIKAYVTLGEILRKQGQFDEALQTFETALALAPDSAGALHGRGRIRRQLKQGDQGLADLQRAIILNPRSAEFRASLGGLLHEQGKFHGALRCYEAALALDGTSPVLHTGRGVVLQGLRRFDEALACFDRVLELVPGNTDAMLNRGNVLGDLGHLDQALACYDEVVGAKGETAPIWNNRGNIYETLQQYDNALACFDRAIALKPDYAVAHWNRALLNLQHGRLEQGWLGYEWRWKNDALTVYRQARNFTEPLWLGKEELADKTILLFAEQGLGDTLQFSRYAPLVAERGARVILEAPAPLTGLLRGLEGVDTVVAQGDPLPPFDFQVPLMTLPLAFGTSLGSIPAPPSYLSSDAARMDEWPARLGKRLRPRVGLVWSGNTQHANDHHRSIPFARLAPLLDLDYQFVSLQKEYREADLAALDACGAIQRMDEHLNDFADTAALCAHMDVVIAVDTSVAHLAGALGKQLWVMLPHVADWRWLTERADTPWYPNARLFRQPRKGDWEAVIDAIAAELTALPRS